MLLVLEAEPLPPVDPVVEVDDVEAPDAPEFGPPLELAAAELPEFDPELVEPAELDESPAEPAPAEPEEPRLDTVAIAPASSRWKQTPPATSRLQNAVGGQSASCLHDGGASIFRHAAIAPVAKLAAMIRRNDPRITRE
ncbi:MAG: hypothetical protein JST54_04590 [Deltaproteobacteria bacterium]|nr:hypothetical protein [Deltaproteobacteria bacterium]